ncbi:MAG: hypothetical protein HYR85_02715 [Planctomycetes bacterium]|nr:hypothetical protein [Planctomycetota bacterium]MBI3844667.1 hypothetical protein [Planctomycetota bacterium]
MNRFCVTTVLGLGLLATSDLARAATPQDAPKPDAAKPAAAKSEGEEMIKPADRPAVLKALADYINADEDDKKRSDLYADLEKKLEKALKPSGIDEMLKSPGYLGRLIQDSQARKSPSGKGHVIPKQNGKQVLQGKTYQVEYSYCVPKAYNPQSAYPLILAFPPAGVAGDKYLDTAFKDEGFREKYVLLAPTLAQGETWFSDTGQFKAIAIVLKTALDDFNIDMNRIFVDGTGESGEDALRLAGSFSDILAGVVVRSGIAQKDVSAVNFRNLPVLFVHAADDPKMQSDSLKKFVDQLQALKYDVSDEKVSGRAHDSCVEANPKILAWFEGKRRTVSVPEIQWSVSDRKFGRAYWLQITRMETGKDVVAQFTAKSDRVKNKIEITSTNVYEFRLMLNDEVVDLDKPLEVLVNGEQAFSGKKERSLRHALDEYHRTGDPTRAFTASLAVNVPTTPTK